MKAQTILRDCLYLNWALPLAMAPKLPAELRFDVYDGDRGKVIFASALLFRQQGLHLAALPYPRLFHPQLNLRLYIQDADGVPSVFFVRMLMPAWVAPAAWVLGQPVAMARFSFPEAIEEASGETWRWLVEGEGSLAVAARLAAPEPSAAPRLGSWEATISFFRHRPRGYAVRAGKLHRIDASQPRVDAWPVAAEVSEHSLLDRLLPGGAFEGLHSAFLCPQIPMSFELAPEAAALAAPGKRVVAAGPARREAA